MASFIRCCAPGAAALFAALVLGGCSTYPKTFSNESPIADFADYRTYNFASRLGTDQDQEVRSLLTQFLIAEVRAQMAQRGYTYAEEDADISFDFLLVTKEKIRSTPSTNFGGYYGYGYGRYPGYGYYGGLGYGGDRITQFTEGSLYVSIVDNATNGVVWEGVSVSRIDDAVLGNLGLSVQTAVSDMFARFPYYVTGVTQPAMTGAAPTQPAS